jgi:hypothetical protein
MLFLFNVRESLFSLSKFVFMPFVHFVLIPSVHFVADAKCFDSILRKFGKNFDSS